MSSCFSDGLLLIVMESRLVLSASKGIRRLSFRMPYPLFYQKQMYVLGRNILTNKRPSENYFHFQTACSILNLFRLNLRMRQSASRSKSDCGRHTLHLHVSRSARICVRGQTATGRQLLRENTDASIRRLRRTRCAER